MRRGKKEVVKRARRDRVGEDYRVLSEDVGKRGKLTESPIGGPRRGRDTSGAVGPTLCRPGANELAGKLAGGEQKRGGSVKATK